MRRNADCHCGSRKRFKHCHGHPNGYEYVEKLSLIEHLEDQIAIDKLRRAEYERVHGPVRFPNFVDSKEGRLVFVGKRYYYEQKRGMFSDFLHTYIRDLLRAQWGNRELELPFEKQHPLVQWDALTTDDKTAQGVTRDESGVATDARGAALSLFSLAYDLYLIQHNHGGLQKELIKRLRDREAFQAVRFEITVAAAMIVAGYDLEFVAPKGVGEKPEYYATRKKSGFKLAIEVKSKRRPGILGHKSDLAPLIPGSMKVTSLLRDARKSGMKAPLLIFLEVNLPATLDESSIHPVADELQKCWDDAEEKARGDESPSLGVIFYNDCSPWYLNQSVPAEKNNIFVLGLRAKDSAAIADAAIMLNEITEALTTRTKIPQQFPGSSPVYD